MCSISVLKISLTQQLIDVIKDPLSFLLSAIMPASSRALLPLCRQKAWSPGFMLPVTFHWIGGCSEELWYLFFKSSAPLVSQAKSGHMKFLNQLLGKECQAINKSPEPVIIEKNYPNYFRPIKTHPRASVQIMLAYFDAK